MTEVARTEGVCKWFNAAKGYGFLDVGDGIDVFAHYSQVMKDGYRTLADGERVSFIMRNGAKGREALEIRTL